MPGTDRRAKTQCIIDTSDIVYGFSALVDDQHFGISVFTDIVYTRMLRNDQLRIGTLFQHHSVVGGNTQFRVTANL